MAFTLKDTPYAGEELAPAVPSGWFAHHRAIHHGGYLKRVNAIVARYPQLQNRTVEDLLRKIDDAPEDIRDELRFQAGGHADHQFLWKILGPTKVDNAPFGELASAITQHFGSFEKFRMTFDAAALALHGPGWAFLSRTAPQGAERLEILVLPGNGSVLPLGKPGILICDLWEHAYEREHGDDRAAWLDAYWKIVNWEECERRIIGLREGRTHL